MLTSEEKEKILELKGDGYSDYKIAKELALDPKTVARCLREEEVDGSGDGFSADGLRAFKRRRGSIAARENLGPKSNRKKDELASEQYDFELEKLDNERNDYRERRGREQREKIEAEGLLKLGQFQMGEAQRRREKEQRRIRHKIQIAKAEALEGLDQILPSVITANVLQEIEGEFSKLKVDEIPSHELVTIAKATRDKVFQDPIFTDSVRESLLNYAWQTSTQLLRNQMKKLYQQAIKQGRFNGSYAEWLGMLANRYPEDGQKKIIEILL